MQKKEYLFWQDITLTDLVYAYRKAKADCFFEKSICISQKFVDFEKELSKNLNYILNFIHEGDIEALLLEHIGSPKIAAKKLSVKTEQKSEEKTLEHSFFSDAERAFEKLKNHNVLQPEFRLIGDFSVEMHVLSALWINIVGHKYDEKLSKAAYGSRLRRYRNNDDTQPSGCGEYHLQAVGSFQPYFQPYKRWREDGLKAIRKELDDERQVIAVSMDITSYYHRLDPTFMAHPDFLNEIGVELNPLEQTFTEAFCVALISWSQKSDARLQELGVDPGKIWTGGIPIGLSASRVISNAFLIKLDRDIIQGIGPVFYGRYVDDIFLVLRDTGHIKSPHQLFEFLCDRIECFPPTLQGDSQEKIILQFDEYQGNSRLELQRSKQKIFFLSGKSGLDLLDNIDKQIRDLSSERRLMPNPDELDGMTSAKVLTAAGHPSEEADTLRRADGLAIRRLSWSVQLRAVEIIARDINKADWKEERKNFYKFAHAHILRPDKILDHIDYLPRLLSLAVSLEEWSDARRMYDAAMTALGKLQDTSSSVPKINGAELLENNIEVWFEFKEAVKSVSADAVIRSIRWSYKKGMHPLSDTALKFCAHLNLGKNFEKLQELSRALLECDWAKTSYKDHLRYNATRERPAEAQEDEILGHYEYEDNLLEFLKSTKDISAKIAAKRINDSIVPNTASSILPYLFPTRPYNPEEVTLFLPNLCVFGKTPERDWARFVQAIRGVWVWPNLIHGEAALDIATASEAEPTEGGVDGSDSPLPPQAVLAKIGAPKTFPKIYLGITSLLTTDASYNATANGSSDISRARYQRIENIVNLAIKAKPRPTHLLLPELSLPEEWVRTVSAVLRDAGISLIAGLDYKHIQNSNCIFSQAALVLTDDRLGFPASIQIRQNKSLPAPKEDQNLQHKFGKIWLDELKDEKKPIYNHCGFYFGVLVCSELQNIGHRKDFQGNVDSLMILSWNQDLETFSSLVEAASLDVHAYIALVNNLSYGDSRIRVPAKENYERDLCRIRGGKNDQVVVVELNVIKLRAFQSRAKRWPDPKDPYKPIPEGFVIAPARKVIPS